ncbi:hypothetical protein CCACVL1_19771 [Corchorus capsularis]|uniref:Uncharacterized protein n=1 Tax=Corchorus capsularis TaxID=210143 RepID=A0A1R3HEW6_COCAP|nr:hypothetical protein CCACVL1_19771 [Corchorus capsularis]
MQQRPQALPPIAQAPPPPPLATPCWRATNDPRA